MELILLCQASSLGRLGSTSIHSVSETCRWRKSTSAAIVDCSGSPSAGCRPAADLKAPDIQMLKPHGKRVEEERGARSGQRCSMVDGGGGIHERPEGSGGVRGTGVTEQK